MTLTADRLAAFTIDNGTGPAPVDPAYMATLLRSIANSIEVGTTHAASVSYDRTLSEPQTTWAITTAPRADEREE